MTLEMVKDEEFVYSQDRGILWLRNGDQTERYGVGYSGHPPFVNDTGAEALAARGPIPRGAYRMVGPFDHVRLGPCVFYLDPMKGTDMHGRSGFFIHGDNEYGNRSASHGCIVLARAIREKLQVAKPRKLVVV